MIPQLLLTLRRYNVYGVISNIIKNYNRKLNITGTTYDMMPRPLVKFENNWDKFLVRLKDASGQLCECEIGLLFFSSYIYIYSYPHCLFSLPENVNETHFMIVYKVV